MQVNQKMNGTVKTIDGKKYKEMLYSAMMALKQDKDKLDSLNVFPVPDGDTGTNMYLTFRDAVKEVRDAKSNNVSVINESLARGALMGARGNSGVILSQLMRGFHLANKDNENFEGEHLVKSLRKASEIAYQGVLKPVEGTILTVSRKAADGAEEAGKKELDLVGIMETTVSYARKALEKTPEMLPALKEAGVVDAGGQGYLTILEGMFSGLTGKTKANKRDFELIKGESSAFESGFDVGYQGQKELEFKYCTQLLLELEKEAEVAEIRSGLSDYGDSLLVVGTEKVIKIHIHSNHPGKVLEYALQLGSINDINIDNMELQSKEKIKKQEARQRQEFNESKSNSYQEIAVNDGEGNTAESEKIYGKGIIAVGQGDGIKSIFKELGVSKIIEGGQTMNPSTNEFIKAVEAINSDEIIILPNNKNVISAARQAASISEKEVVVVPSRSIPQAISSLMVFNPEAQIEDLKEAMNDELDNVKTIEITRAVKDSKVNGIEIKKNDIIGLFNHDIKTAGNDYSSVIINLIKEISEDEELLTIYYGEDIELDEAEKMKDILIEEFNFDDIEIYNGKQPLYPFIISLE